MTGTFTTPYGKLRSASTCRYLVICADWTTPGRVRILKRSDNLKTATDRCRKGARPGFRSSVLDTHTGEVVYG